MNKLTLFGGIAAVLIGQPKSALHAQADSSSQRVVRIEITRTENGETTRITRELPAGVDDALEEALREAGMWEAMELGEGENMVIDLRRMQQNGGVLKDMCLAIAGPMACEKSAFLGVHSEASTGKGRSGSENGARITKVVEGSPAARAGLHEGDIITSLGEDRVDGPASLLEAVLGHGPGTNVKVNYLRDGKKMNAKVELGCRPAETAWTRDEQSLRWGMAPEEAERNAYFFGLPATKGAFLGVSGGDADEGRGAKITKVIPGTAAEHMGLKSGDVIVEFSGTAVHAFDQLAELIGMKGSGEKVSVAVLRDGQRLKMEGELGEHGGTWNYALPPTPGVAPVPPIPPMAPYLFEGIKGLTPRDREKLQREMDELRREMEDLRRDLRGDMLRRTMVVVTRTELSPGEKDLLVKRGVSGLDRTLELPDLQCHPNPSQGSFQLRFDVPERGDLVVDVHNGNGERVYHETITGFKGRYERLLDLSDQANGTYFLVITQGGRSVARKLVKQ